MKIPNGDNAFVDIAKLRDYSLNPQHPEGKHKARVFDAALGIDLADAEWLCEELLRVAREESCQPGKFSTYGQRYLIDFTLSHHGKTALLRSAWITLHGQQFPRLTSCYVL
jgi:hypothetical protein